MTDDVRLSVGLRRHRKTKRLKRLIGAEGCWALVCLFLWAGEERWTGDLSGLSDADIEEEADWDGEPGELVHALVSVGFLVGEPGERLIHDWLEHNPYAASKGDRIEKGKSAANARWEKARKSKDADATSMPAACQQHATTNAEQYPPAPTPAPTYPKEQKQKADAPPAKRGHRLPPDWEPSDDDVAFAVEQRVNWRRELESFRDYWHGKAGANATKLDWSATWRNWIRRAQKSPQAQQAPAKSRTLSAIERIGRMTHGGGMDGAGNWNGLDAPAVPALAGPAARRYGRGDGDGLG